LWGSQSWLQAGFLAGPTWYAKRGFTIMLARLTFVSFALMLTQPAVDWQAMIPAIREALHRESLHNFDFRGIEEHHPI
jgi:hypothetical protein